MTIFTVTSGARRATPFAPALPSIFATRGTALAAGTAADVWAAGRMRGTETAEPRHTSDQNSNQNKDAALVGARRPRGQHPV